MRVDGRSPDEVNDALDLLIAAGMDVDPFWLTHARRAGLIRAEHYHRTRSPISLADAACIATAGLLASDLATSDAALARVADVMGIGVVRLRDSTGKLRR